MAGLQVAFLGQALGVLPAGVQGTMRITFHCPHCESELEVDAEEAGTRVDCPACSQECRAPVPRVGPGTVLGNFAIERKLGSGGMGDVYVARQVSMDRLVALKVLPQAHTRKPSVVERFRHEVRMSARLEHPHVVTAFEAGEDFGYLYLAMSYVDGEDLRSRLKRTGPLAEREVLGYARQIADALGYAWTTFRMLHRDVKPGNILVDRKGNARIMDLGISKCLAENEDADLTVSGMLVGTPHYMSPEQASSGAELDCRADIYSLGATLYHLLTGATPYQGQTATDVLRQLGVQPVPPLRELNSIVTEPCAKLVARMMALSRDHRQASWDAVITDIDRVLAGREPLLGVGDTAPEAVGRAGAPAGAGMRAGPGGGAPGTAAAAPLRVPPVMTPAAREGSGSGRAGMASDSAEFRTPPKIDLRQREVEGRWRRRVRRAGLGLVLAAGGVAALYYGCRLRRGPGGLRGHGWGLPTSPAPPEAAVGAATPPPGPAEGAAAAALEATPEAVVDPAAGSVAGAGPALAVGMVAVESATGPAPAAVVPAVTPASGATLGAAVELRLASALSPALDEFLAGRPENAADMLTRAAREPVLAPVEAELHRSAAVLSGARQERALLRQSLTGDVGQVVTLQSRGGPVRLKLVRADVDAAVGLRLPPGATAPAGSVRVPYGDLADAEVVDRLRGFVGKPAGDAALTLALWRSGRQREALDPISRLPPLLRDALRARVEAGPAAAQ